MIVFSRVRSTSGFGGKPLASNAKRVVDFVVSAPFLFKSNDANANGCS